MPTPKIFSKPLAREVGFDSPFKPILVYPQDLDFRADTQKHPKTPKINSKTPINMKSLHIIHSWTMARPCLQGGEARRGLLRGSEGPFFEGYDAPGLRFEGGYAHPLSLPS